jgi:hypothetical protein
MANHSKDFLKYDKEKRKKDYAFTLKDEHSILKIV